MPLRRLALVALVLTAALPLVPASAAAKPKPKPLPCKQITDDEGDGRVNTLGVSSPALDVLSADLSTGRNEVTAILRLKSTAVENDLYLKGGANWAFKVSAGSITYAFHAEWPSIVYPKQQLTGGLTAGNSKATPDATFRREGDTFRWTVSRAAIPALKKAKAYITILSASSGADNFSADTAFSKGVVRYLDKTPTCLPSK